MARQGAYFEIEKKTAADWNAKRHWLKAFSSLIFFFFPYFCSFTFRIPAKGWCSFFIYLYFETAGRSISPARQRLIQTIAVYLKVLKIRLEEQRWIRKKGNVLVTIQMDTVCIENLNIDRKNALFKYNCLYLIVFKQYGYNLYIIWSFYKIQFEIKRSSYLISLLQFGKFLILFLSSTTLIWFYCTAQ